MTRAAKPGSNNNEMHYYYQQKYMTKEWAGERDFDGDICTCIGRE